MNLHKMGVEWYEDLGLDRYINLQLIQCKFADRFTFILTCFVYVN